MTAPRGGIVTRYDRLPQPPIPWGKWGRYEGRGDTAWGWGGCLPVAGDGCRTLPVGLCHGFADRRDAAGRERTRSRMPGPYGVAPAGQSGPRPPRTPSRARGVVQSRRVQ